MSRKAAILIPYFGDWPVWIDFFVESCRSNRSFDWFLIGDSKPPENRAPNVKHIQVPFDEYKAQLSEALQQDLSRARPYKLCDYRPALPFVHRDLLNRHDFVGFGDLDVIYGNLGLFYDDETLDRYDVLSSHRDRVSGHFFLMRNSEELVTAFHRIPGWKKALSSEANLGFDERDFFNFLRAKKRGLFKRPTDRPRGLFREAYSTPAATQAMRWFWDKGRLTNEFYPHHEFAYLHFMSWHSARWLEFQPGVAPGADAPWSTLPEVVRMDWRDARTQGFMISPSGIEPIEPPKYH